MKKPTVIYPITGRDLKVLKQLDGHYCWDWDELPVSAWTPEYSCCNCYGKTWLGELVNWLWMEWFYWRERKCRVRG